MKIGLITTLNHNIGDDFVRFGIINLLNQIYDTQVRYISINKHKPMEVYDNFIFPRILNKIFYSFSRGNRFYEKLFS